jgi:predicted membrane-bound spermidine synthase
MAWFFVFFFISGFCSLLYELVWMRLAIANFGVTTPLMSIVLSVFMAGLGLGSWLAGRLVRRYGDRLRFPALRIYAAVEALIGASAVTVPAQLAWGHAWLQKSGPDLALSSTGYYCIAGSMLVAILLPWCGLMGATFPLAMLAMPRRERSFSLLYVANVSGAALGTVAPLILIELGGLHRTLLAGCGLNFLIAAIAWTLANKLWSTDRGPQMAVGSDEIRPSSLLWLLFLTGTSSMGMEVVWTRLFTPYLGTLVYSFATILLVYLLATYIGSRLYRRRRAPEIDGLVWMLLGLAGVLCLLAADPSVPLPALLRPVVGIALFAGLLGFITPMLVDRWSGGDPTSAGRAYAVNILGCVAGPLLAGFVLLPHSSERSAVVLLVLPWFAVGIFSATPRRTTAYAALAAAVGLVLVSRTYDQLLPSPRILRDSTATVIATTIGRRKELLINGIGTTRLLPITKMMAHLPLAELGHPAKKVLVIGFGMGTAHRSVLTWGVDSTVVELVPSVPRMFSYYHADGDRVLASSRSHLVIDDGRRYLERSREKFDVIVLDPPPPVEAAGTSLLYSCEFYRLAKAHLSDDGILQQWLPYGDPTVESSMAQALALEFPYVRGFRGFGGIGFHFLASMSPMVQKSSAALAATLPAAAAADLLEFGPHANPESQFEAILQSEFPLQAMIAAKMDAPVLRDDRPVNEFFVLRATPNEIENIRRAQVGAWMR